MCQWLLSPVIEKCLLSMRNSWFLICLALGIVGTTAANYNTVTSLHTYLHTYNTAVHWKSVNFFLIFLNSWSVAALALTIALAMFIVWGIFFFFFFYNFDYTFFVFIFFTFVVALHAPATSGRCRIALSIIIETISASLIK